MNIPLINSNSKQDINTSLIAIRNAINELSRMKESASVEDLQRQINIINQQITNFNSEFSAINTHLNTIDTNILNLQPVDTVASGNLHSVTSNAVARNNIHAIRDYWSEDPNNPVDVIAVIESYADLIPSMSEDIHVRMGTRLINSPYGATVQDCDFIFDIKKTSISQNNWIRVIAYDIRSNRVYTISKVNGTWGNWYQIQFVEYLLRADPIITNGIPINFANVRFRNGVYHLIARFFTDSAVSITEGQIIGRLRSDYYMNPSWDFPVNVHNFLLNEDYLLWIYNNGDIRIFSIGTRTVTLDFYIDTTYVK